MGLDEWLGRRIRIAFRGEKTCIHCGRRVRKLYQSGYCFPCVTTLAECDLCIVKPHECHYHLGTCRDPQFGDQHCMIPHYVYLADSSQVKVGLTRKGRQLTRWVDQGATSALLVAEVPTRKVAGELEMEVAKRLPDKTDWRKMLRATGDTDADLEAVRAEVVAQLPEPYQAFVLTDQRAREVYHFHYPRGASFELKVRSVTLDKEPVVEGTLLGCKGQYVLLDSGVWNAKKHAGYHVTVEPLA